MQSAQTVMVYVHSWVFCSVDTWYQCESTLVHRPSSCHSSESWRRLSHRLTRISACFQPSERYNLVVRSAHYDHLGIPTKRFSNWYQEVRGVIQPIHHCSISTGPIPFSIRWSFMLSIAALWPGINPSLPDSDLFSYCSLWALLQLILVGIPHWKSD